MKRRYYAVVSDHYAGTYLELGPYRFKFWARFAGWLIKSPGEYVEIKEG